MAVNPSIQLGTDGNWAIKEDNLLAYKQLGNKFFDREFDFSRGTTATFVGRNGLIQESAIDVPRIDFTDDTTGHLLLEPQSTNLLPYSNDFSQSSWIKNGIVITSNNGVSPEGIINASTVNFSASNQYLLNNKTITTTIGSSVSMSIYANTDTVGFLSFGGATPSGTDVSNVENLLGGFYRHTITRTFTVATTNTVQFIMFGAAIGDYLIYGAQLEQKSYPTSYIPTSGSAVTRNQELCNNSGTVNDFNSEEGVLYLEVSRFANDILNTAISITQSGNFTNSVSIRFRSTENLIYGLIYSSGNISTLMQYTLSDDTQFNKIAISYAENNFSLWVNGIKVLTDTSGSAPIGLNNLSFNLGTEPFYGKTKNLKVFKRALTDAELQELTTDETSYSSFTALAPEAVSYYYYSGDGSGLINFELNNEGLPILDNSNIKAAVNAYLDGDLDDIELWDVSNVTIMYALFQSTSFNQDISNWDTSNVTNMAFMFTRARAFNQPIGNWDVSSVSNLYRMFEEADSFNQDISSWDLTNYTGSGQDFMNGVTLSTANYDNLLISWAAKMLVAYPGGSGYNPSPSWNFGNSVHTIGGDAETAKNTLVNTFNWTITDAN